MLWAEFCGSNIRLSSGSSYCVAMGSVVKGSEIVCRRTVDSPIGPVTLTATRVGLSGVEFGRPDSPPPPRAGLSPSWSCPIVDDAERQLGEYFTGERTRFDLALDLHGTEFQVAAWRALLNASFGSTMTYAQQAAAIGRPTAVRAVGAANGRNPVAIVLPCHRVIGSSGALTGFAGGLDVKRWLLDHERSVLSRTSST